MKKKKTDPATKARVEAIQGRLRKAGPMKDRRTKRLEQKTRRYDQSVE